MFRLLKAHGLTDLAIENMMGWHNSGFSVYCGPAIWPGNDTGIENLARYILRAAFSRERMRYIPDSASADGQAEVIYQSKDGRDHYCVPNVRGRCIKNPVFSCNSEYSESFSRSLCLL